MAERPARKKNWDWKFILGVVLLAVVGLWIYRPVLHGDWLWDDDVLILHNSLVRDPAGWWKIWLEPQKLLDYQPLGISVIWLEWRLWHGHAWGYHVANVGCHLIGALLLWRLLAKFGLHLAWLGALLFVVHPVTVESVAWISEFKNTLSLPPFLLAIIHWIDYEEHGRRRDYQWALGLFLAAMLIKTSMVMFPFVLLLYAWWKRGHVSRADLKAGAPFFAVSLVLGLVTVWYVHHNVMEVEKIPLVGVPERIAVAGLSFAFYFSKCFLPVSLLPIYPQWPMLPLKPWQFLPWPILLGILYWFWTQRAGWGRHALLGLGFFLLMLAPFVGFTDGSYMHFTWVMDHLVYIPLIGLIAIIIAGLGRLEASLPPSILPFGGALIAVALVLMAAESHAYARLFFNQETLWTYTLRYNPNAYLAHNNLGIALSKTGRIPEAIDQYEQALRLDSLYPEAHNNLGIALGKMGRNSEAIAQYEETLRLNPDYVQAHNNLGTALLQDGQVSEAIDQFQQTLRLDPEMPEAHNNLGNALLLENRFSEAIDECEKAVHLNPGLAQAHNNLGFALRKSGRTPEAIEQFKEALQIIPGYVDARNNLGIALFQAGRLPEAIEQFEIALRLDPTNAAVRGNLEKVQAMEPAAK